MNRMGDFKEKFIEEESLQYCKIVDMDANGVTSVKQENLEKILDAINSLKIQEDTPSAVITMTGSNEGAKFILMNFLFDTLEGKGEQTQQQLGAVEAFVWSHSHRADNSASIQRFLNNMEAANHQGDDTHSEGIFLWPEPFIVKNHDENQTAIWIMNVCRKEGTNSEELEEITAMLSSRVMKLECFPDNIRLRVLDPYRPIPVSSDASYPEPINLEKICDSSTNEFRCSPLSDNTEHLTDNDNVMRNVCAAKALNKMLKIIVNTIIEETVVATSSETNTNEVHALKIENMKEVITSAVKKANERHQQRKKFRLKMEKSSENASKQVKERFPRFLDRWMKNQFSISKKQEILEVYSCLKKEVLEKFTNAINTSLWKEFNELVDALCKIEMEEILKHGFKYVDMLTRLAEQQNQLLGYLPPEKLNEISKEVLKQVEDFSEGKILILKVCKLAHERIADFYKQENQKILDNEKELFVQDATHLGKVYYDEVEKYLSNASYNPQTLKTLRQKLLARICGEIKSTFKTEAQDASNELEAQKRKLEKEKVVKEKDKMESEAAVEQVKANKKKQQKEIEAAQKTERDSKKKKAQEELRQEEEKARLDMEEYLPVAASKVKFTLQHSIKYWIQNHLELSSVNQMETIYAHTVKGLTEGEEQHQKVVNKKLYAEFVSRLDALCKDECMVTLKSISQPVMKINQAMKEQFRLRNNLRETKMAQTANEELRKETGTTAEGLVLDMIKFAVERLLEIYKKQNKIYIEANEVVTAYRGHMEQYMANAPYSPPKLHTLHSELIEKLVDAFKKSYHLEKSVDGAASSQADILSNRINREFEQYRIANEKKITKLQEETKKAIQKMKTQYNEKVEEILCRYPDGLDAKTLDKYHTTIVTEVKKLLQMELRSNVREQEHLEKFLKVLQDYIDKYWLTVVEKNERNIKKNKEKDANQHREKKRLQAQRELQQQQEAAARKKRAFSEGSSGEHSTVYQHRSRNTEKSRAPLPTLVFHLQSSRISMAMNGKGHFEMLKNQSGEEQTPAFVALTAPPESTFVYGSEAIVQFSFESPSTSDLKIFTWSIADFFRDTNSTWTKTVVINGQNHTITAEFLLAFLLRKLKNAAEDLKNGKCDTAVLAIPFWLSSTQRIKVKHAVKIAGFSESYLINEASAAAFNFVLGDIRSVGKVLIISENLDRVDVFVYSFAKHESNIKMVAHSGNYDENVGDRKPWPAINAIRNYVSGFLLGQETGHNDKDRALRDVSRACKTALDLATSELRTAVKIEPNECLFICENVEKWEKMLESVAKEFVRKSIGISKENVVLQGAVALSMNPNIMANYISDKLAYDVLRSSNGGTKIISKLDTLPVQCSKQATILPQGQDKALIYQCILGSQRPIGELFVEGVCYSQTLELTLEITYEAIVNFKYVMATSNSTDKREYKRAVADEKLHWKTPNLTKEQLDAFADLLELLVKLSVAKEALTAARKDLLLKCQEMCVRIETGQYEIKSSLAKTMVLDKVSVAQQVAENTNISLEGIRSQMESLQKLCGKYNRK